MKRYCLTSRPAKNHQALLSFLLKPLLVLTITVVALPAAVRAQTDKTQTDKTQTAQGQAESVPSDPAMATESVTTLPKNSTTLTDSLTQASALESIANIQSKLNSLSADTAIDSTLKERLTASYRATLDSLNAFALDAERVATRTQSLESAPEKLALARQKIKEGLPTFTAPKDADQLTIEELRRRRSESEAALNAARAAVQSIETAMRERDSSRERLPKLITEARNALDSAEAAPVPELNDDPQGLLKSARDTERAARIAALRQKSESMVQEQATIDSEIELLPAQREIALSEVESAEQALRFWSEKLGMQKQYHIENDLSEHRQRLEAFGIDVESSLVLSLAGQWVSLIQDFSRLERKLTLEQSRLAEMTTTLKSTQAEIDRDLIAGRSLRSGLGLKLQMTRKRLPSSSALADDMQQVDEQIDRGRAFQTEMELTLESLRGDPLSALSMRPETRLPMLDGVVDPHEVTLLKELKADLDQQLNLLVDLKGTLELKRKIVSDIRLLIERHVVWIRSASPYRFSDFITAWWNFRWIIHPSHGRSIVTSLGNGLSQRPDLVVAWCFLGLGLWCFGPRIRRYILHAGELVREAKFSSDSTLSMRPTIVALLFTILLAVPPVTTLAIAGFAVLAGAGTDSYLMWVGSALLLAAAAFFPTECLRQMLRPGGVAVAHFGYRSEIVAPPRTSLRLLIDLGTPLLIVWSIANASGGLQMDASLGRLLFAVGMIVLTQLFWNALHPSTGLLTDYLAQHPSSWPTRLKRVWHPGISALPLVLAGLSLAGYSYTATLLTGRLYWTLWLSIVVIVMGGLLRQWFFTYRLRASIAQKPERIALPLQTEIGLLDVQPEPAIDKEEMNAQSMRLIRALLWIILIGGTVVIWAPVFPALHFLDLVPLWNSTAADGSLVPVTLANLIITIPIVFLSVVSVRNIPGLLESVLLERLPLERPAKYAITTLASYALALIGILISARTLGLRWEGIQWLVAALSVGLGFGLQEIFANFMSGLILLFEQPIRVGDVVTIDGVTGTVSRIRMRATAVTNYDRQELIIPNKDLITGRLINWTLTDSTNRIMLHIGIAYGSDSRKACHLLEQICAQHENLLVDPPPVVTFESFGDSTLNLVVRCFLGKLDQRLKTIHELNTTINERFQYEGIEIAFPQRDLHIRSLPPQLLSVMTGRT